MLAQYSSNLSPAEGWRGRCIRAFKNKEYADRVSELFGIASQFEEKMDSLVHDYEIERNRINNEGIQ